MPNDLENLRCALRRQSTAGTRAILFLALIMFGPRAYDYAIGEPWITGSLSVLRSSDGRYLVEDTVTANNPVYGDRQILLETVDGTVLCSSRWSGSWDATTKRNWELSALAGASCQAPDRTFRICSIFSLYSQSGRHRSFAPICSPETNPNPTIERKK